MISFSIVDFEISVVRKAVGQDQYRQKQKSDRHLQCWMQSIRHRVPSFFGAPRTSPLLCASATCPLVYGRRKKISVPFLFGEFFCSPSPKSCTQKCEEATRQQGGFFFRENSSNGGKAIRTFWRNTKFGKIPCQG